MYGLCELCQKDEARHTMPKRKGRAASVVHLCDGCYGKLVKPAPKRIECTYIKPYSGGEKCTREVRDGETRCDVHCDGDLKAECTGCGVVEQVVRLPVPVTVFVSYSKAWEAKHAGHGGKVLLYQPGMSKEEVADAIQRRERVDSDQHRP